MGAEALEGNTYVGYHCQGVDQDGLLEEGATLLTGGYVQVPFASFHSYAWSFDIGVRQEASQIGYQGNLANVRQFLKANVGSGTHGEE